MEIPQSSSIAQATAYFTGFSEEEQRRQILNLLPDPGPNVLLESTDRSQAISFTGESTDFRIADRVEGHRILQGALQYPFHQTAEIFNHKFDPLYYDGSESQENFNVQENLIGRPLGADVLQDHRLAYVDNLLKLKEYQGANSALDDDYIKQLYLANTEKGANYYFNQLQDLRESMGMYARSNADRNSLPLHDIHFLSKIQRGVGSHPKSLKPRPVYRPSTSMNVQSNHRQDQMRGIERRFQPPRVDVMPPPPDVTLLPNQESNKRKLESEVSVNGTNYTDMNKEDTNYMNKVGAILGGAGASLVGGLLGGDPKNIVDASAASIGLGVYGAGLVVEKIFGTVPNSSSEVVPSSSSSIKPSGKPTSEAFGKKGKT